MRKHIARGTMLGLAVGDALGAPLEFSYPGVFPFGKPIRGPISGMVAGGPFNLLAGQVTDDTHMACALAESLVETAKTGYDAETALKKYLCWRGATFDCGMLTSAALRIAEDDRVKYGPYVGGFGAWRAKSMKPSGNGSLMRTAPIGVHMWFVDDAIKYGVQDSMVTHFDPRCALACGVLDGLIAQRTYWETPPEGLASEALVYLDIARVHMLDVVRSVNLFAMFTADLPSIVKAVDSAVDDLTQDIQLAQQSDPLLYGETPLVDEKGFIREPVSILKTKGFVRTAFRLALWEALHAESFEDGILDVVNRGGDSDTNGAIAGALLGAIHGESGIPEEWRTAVLECNPSRAGFGKDELYHPNTLLHMVESLCPPST